MENRLYRRHEASTPVAGIAPEQFFQRMQQVRERLAYLVQLQELKETHPVGKCPQARAALGGTLKEFCELKAHPIGWQDIHAMDEDLVDRALSCLKS